MGWLADIHTVDHSQSPLIVNHHHRSAPADTGPQLDPLPLVRETQVGKVKDILCPDRSFSGVADG